MFCNIILWCTCTLSWYWKTMYEYLQTLTCRFETLKAYHQTNLPLQMVRKTQTNVHDKSSNKHLPSLIFVVWTYDLRYSPVLHWPPLYMHITQCPLPQLNACVLHKLITFCEIRQFAHKKSGKTLLYKFVWS